MINTERIAELSQKIMNEVSEITIGKDEIKKLLLVALLAEGHMLIEGLPGTAKTKLAKTFAEVIGGKFKRIQFTPDMMPADVTGFYFYSPDGSYRFIEGPVFANIILADELNRTTPRTQSALIEAMQEYQVTIEKESHALSRPFMVIATQLETGAEGTYPLTDVQVDRFMLRALSGYPLREEEKEIITNIDRIDETQIGAVISLDEIREIQAIAKEVEVSPNIVEYITSIIESLRLDPDVGLGPSPRAGIALYKCSRVLALLDGRDFVIPDDVKFLVFPAVEHRIRVKPEAEMDDITPRVILERELDQVPVPKPI